MFGYQPMIPDALMHTMQEIKSGASFSQERDGQWIPGTEERIPFKGVVLPVNDKDLIRDTAGSFTQCSEKVYTNGYTLQIGAQVMDGDGTRYTVVQELGHNSLHPIKRYLLERKEASAPK